MWIQSISLAQQFQVPALLSKSIGWRVSPEASEEQLPDAN